MSGLGALAACGGEALVDPDLAAQQGRLPSPPSPVVPPPPTVHPAFGPFDELDAEARRLYLHPEAFTELGDPTAYSWRDRVEEPGQSFPEFIVSRPNRPRSPRNRLYLLPLGVFPNELVVEPEHVVLVRSPPLSWLAEFLERFYGLPTVVMEPRWPEDADLPTRVRGGHEQIDARGLLDAVAPLLPSDAYAMIALLNRDMFAFDQQQYAFGYGLHRDRLAAMSFARFDPIFIGRARTDSWERDIERRSLVVLGHEVGHTFGMRHCTYYACVMNGMSHPQEVDTTPLHLCPVCLRKLCSLGAIDPLARYESLEGFYDAAGLFDSAQWVQRRLAHARPELSARSVLAHPGRAPPFTARAATASHTSPDWRWARR